MSKYKVLNPVKTPDGIVREGYIEVAAGEVEELTRAGVIGEQEPVLTSAPVERTAEIQAAISQLDMTDVALWLKDGSPKTESIAAITGYSVSAAERDAAWLLSPLRAK